MSNFYLFIFILIIYLIIKLPWTLSKLINDLLEKNLVFKKAPSRFTNKAAQSLKKAYGLLLTGLPLLITWFRRKAKFFFKKLKDGFSFIVNYFNNYKPDFSKLKQLARKVLPNNVTGLVQQASRYIQAPRAIINGSRVWRYLAALVVFW